LILFFGNKEYGLELANLSIYSLFTQLYAQVKEMLQVAVKFF